MQVSNRAPLSATMLVFNSASMFDSVMITSFRRKGKEYSSRTCTSVKNLSRKGSYSYKLSLISMLVNNIGQMTEGAASTVECVYLSVN